MKILRLPINSRYPTFGVFLITASLCFTLSSKNTFASSDEDEPSIPSHHTKKYDRHFDNEKHTDDEHKNTKEEKNCKATPIDWAMIPEPVHQEPVQEKLLYVGTINQGGEEDPDMLLVIGVDPDNPDEYGKLLHRMDLPNIGDEVHHFGYNAARTKIILPGLYSSRIHIVNLDDPKKPYIETINDDLVEDSHYTHPHTVIGLPNGNNMISMLGADTESTAPGGLIEVCGDTGEFLKAFGPKAKRDHTKKGPTYMYDVGFKPELNRMITTTFGLPKDIEVPLTWPDLATKFMCGIWGNVKLFNE